MAAATHNRVKIHEATKIKPIYNTTTEFSLPLTYFDAFWFKFLPVERVFFYQITELTSDFFNLVILPKLKNSLSFTLLHYLPVAGNLMWPEDATKPAIYYFPNVDGVSVTVAESEADFNTLSSNEIREAVEFRPLIPQLPIFDDKAAVIAIQITLFPNQGFCIGISYHHALLDGKSSTMFVKSWAHICKQLVQQEKPSLLPELTPCFDRTVIKDPEGLDIVYPNHWMLAFPGSDSNPNARSLKLMPDIVAYSNLKVRGTFELTREDIKNLRDKVISTNEVSKSKELHLSTYVLACAYLYVCLVKAKGVEANTSIMFGIGADCRSRLDPPIPVNYFGNCVGGGTTAAKAIDFIKENGVAFIAEKISDLVKGLKGDAIEGSKEKIVTILAALKEGVPGEYLSVAGSNRFNVYGLDFGWGRPKKVEIVSIDRTGAISLAESRDGGGGMEVGVVLEKQQMEVFVSLFVDGLKSLH